MRIIFIFSLSFCFVVSSIAQEFWSDPERIVDPEHYAENQAILSQLPELNIPLQELPLEFWENLEGLDRSDAFAIKTFIDSSTQMKSIWELICTPDLDERKLYPHIPLLSSFSLKPVDKKWKLKNALKWAKQELVIRIEWDPDREITAIELDSMRSLKVSPVKFYTRYRFYSVGRLSAGLVLETDPGEALPFQKNQAWIDFVAGHIAIENLGILKQLIIGDYRILWGNGLWSWTGFGIGKGVPVCNLIPHASILKPYTSSNEYSFYRGLSARFQFKSAQFIPFLSHRNFDASVDTIGENRFQSIRQDGIHNSAGTLARKKQLQASMAGIVFKYGKRSWEIGTLIQGSFLSANRQNLASNFYQSRDWTGSWIGTISQTFKIYGKHSSFFSELVFLNNGAHSFSASLSWKAAPQIEIATAIRSASTNYFSFFPNGPFADSKGRNEKGIHLAMRFTPIGNLNLQAYADIYTSNWLAYREDRPISNLDFFLQADYVINRTVRISSRFRRKVKMQNLSSALALPEVLSNELTQLRFSCSFPLSASLQSSSKIEWSWADSRGLFISQDLIWKAPQVISLVLRWSIYQIESYNARIYAYEHTPLYMFGLPSFSGIGNRIYTMLKLKIGRNFQSWIKAACTLQKSGEAEVFSNMDSLWEFDFQIRFSF